MKQPGSALRVGLAAGIMFVGAAEAAFAQTVATLPGVYAEGEGQHVLGASDLDVGLIPDFDTGTFAPQAVHDGRGSGGAATVGYSWSNGWSAAVQYRRLETDNEEGPFDSLVINSLGPLDADPGAESVFFPLLNASVDVSTNYSALSVEAAKEFALGANRIQVFGAVRYQSLDRAVDVIGGIPDFPAVVTFTDKFHGLGPQAGLRGGLQIVPGLALIGGASVAVLFGESEFASGLTADSYPGYAFTAQDRRTVAALDGEGGVSISLGAGALTFGYRVDALRGVFDPNQRVPAGSVALGYPQIGEPNDDFLAHGPFARLTVPFGTEDE